MRRLAIGLILLAVSANAAAEEIVKVFRGSGNEMTAIFKVDSPWLLDWRLDGDYDKLIALDVTLIEAYTGRHVGRVLDTKTGGKGRRLKTSCTRIMMKSGASPYMTTGNASSSSASMPFRQG